MSAPELKVEEQPRSDAVEYLERGFVTMPFTRSGIEFIGNTITIGLRNVFHAATFKEALAFVQGRYASSTNRASLRLAG